MTARHKLILLLLLLVGIALNLLTFVIWNPAYIANDGIQYISTAENWLTGNGFSTNALIYAPHFQGALPALQTVWPPGYPIAIGMASFLGFDLEATTLLTNLVTHATGSLVMWLIFLKMGIDRFFATVCAFIFYLLAAPWMYVSAGLTEPLFNTLLLLGLLYLPVPHKSRLYCWIACGLFLSASVLVRYSSVFAAFGTGAGIFIYLILYERRAIEALVKPCIKLTLLISLPTVVFGYLMYRTYVLTGTLDRYSGSKIPETLASTAKRWVAKLSELIGFSVNDPSHAWLAVFWFLIFSVLVAGIVFVFLFGDRNYLKLSSIADKDRIDKNRTDNKDYLRLITLVVFSHNLALLLYLTVNSVQSNPLEIVTRYLYQMYPGIYAVFCYMLFAVFKQYSYGKKQTILKLTTSALVVIYLTAQLNSLRVTRPYFFSGSTKTVEIMNIPVNNSVNIKSFIKQCFATGKAGKSIWSPHAQAIHLHTGIPSISKSHNYTDKPFNADEFQDQVNQYQTGMFMFYSYLEHPTEIHKNHMNSVRSWLLNNNYSMVDLPSNTFGANQKVDIYVTDPNCGFSK